MSNEIKQFELNYQGSLLQQYPDFMDAVQAGVRACGVAFKNVASDLDMSKSELSRRLNENPNDTMHFHLSRFDDLLEATGDLTPLYWLCEKYLQDSDQRKKQAMDQIVKMMPEIAELLKQAKGDA